jgi:preprotein translocase subunit SecE
MAFTETLKGWLAAVKGWPARTKLYFSEVWSELKKVSWPVRQEVYGTTIVVIVSVFIFGFYLWLVDILLEYGIVKLYRFFGVTS